eukprot:1787749-Pyramimonas_sp.AAC.1
MAPKSPGGRCRNKTKLSKWGSYLDGDGQKNIETMRKLMGDLRHRHGDRARSGTDPTSGAGEGIASQSGGGVAQAN